MSRRRRGNMVIIFERYSEKTSPYSLCSSSLLSLGVWVRRQLFFIVDLLTCCPRRKSNVMYYVMRKVWILRNPWIVLRKVAIDTLRKNPWIAQ